METVRELELPRGDRDPSPVDGQEALPVRQDYTGGGNSSIHGGSGKWAVARGNPNKHVLATNKEQQGHKCNEWAEEEQWVPKPGPPFSKKDQCSASPRSASVLEAGSKGVGNNAGAAMDDGLGRGESEGMSPSGIEKSPDSTPEALSILSGSKVTTS